jgi:hypothetical protein
MKSSGLLSTFAPIFSESAARLVPVRLREPCRLPYSWRFAFSDLRVLSSNLWRQAQRSCPPSSRLQRAVTKPFWVVSQKAGHWYQKSAHRENILPPNLQDGCRSPENKPTASAHAFLELFSFCTTAAAIWRLMQTMVTRRTRTTGLFVAA